VNHGTKTTQWQHPRTGRKKAVSDSLPFGWERQVLTDNTVVYVDHNNKKTTFSDPRLAFAVEEKKEGSFRQRYDASTRALQVLHGKDLSGTVAVVTGASSGVGYETARAMARHGCRVVLACRSEERAEAAMARIRKERSQAMLRFLPLDLQSLDSVKRFVMRFRVEFDKLDYLVLNAGVFGLGHQVTEDGFETIMQVNYISHFYLTLLLHKTLCASYRSRVVVLTSESHRFSEMTADSVTPRLFQPAASEFSSILQYNDSKLLCLLFAQTLSRKFRHLGVRCNAVHPGNMISTGLSSSWWFYRLLFLLFRPFTKSADQAAGSVVFSLASPEMEAVERFTYINNCFPTRPGNNATAEMGEAAWDMTIACLGKRLADGDWVER